VRLAGIGAERWPFPKHCGKAHALKTGAQNDRSRMVGI